MLGASACGNQAAQVRTSPTPLVAVESPSWAASPLPTPTPVPSHVFVIVMENRSYSQALAGRYTAQLAATYGVATNYHGVTHPSLPNYLAMTSGSTWGIADDGYHTLPAGGLGAQLTNAGVSWRAYMEGMAGGCFHSGYPYALKHNPFAYYGGTCPANVVNFTQFAGDVAASTIPRFVWITPGLCHDGHDCSTAVADAWLAQTVPTILATSAWKDSGLLFITWDEGEDSANSVLTLVIHPGAHGLKTNLRYDHYNLLATIEDALGVARLGAAGTAWAMSDLTTT
ncbi:MAG TPA: alkaline phosphatase family protein [Candidatus Dormibacteraeota bacterium]|nr:alkaline phosphatase family protein [Candidatus Dormibacteraeota bacterium]